MEAVREAIASDSPDIFTNNGELERMAGCQRYAALDPGDEFNAETKASIFVPWGLLR